MRILSKLLRPLALLAAALVIACSGDNEAVQPQSTETVQQQTQAQTAAQPQPRPQQQAQVQQDAQANQTEQAQAQPAPDSANAAARAALEAWTAELSTVELSVEVELESDFIDFNTVTNVALQVEPLTIWVQVELPEELAAMLGDDEMQLLLSEDGAYLSMEQFEGWVDFGAVAGLDIAALLGTTGFDPASITDPEQLAASFDCLDAANGEVREDTYEGRPVWMLDCEIDPEAMTAATDELANSTLGLPDSGVEFVALRMIMVIDRDSGAPLLIDSDLTVADPESGAESQVRSSTRLLRWNQPLEFPVPEPLVDPSVLELMGGPVTNGEDAAQPDADAFTPEAQLALVEAWFAEADALALEITIEAMIAGEARRADTLILRSLSQGKFETATVLDEGVSFRFLWTRDGLWLSEADDPDTGAAQWVPTDLALIGSRNRTVDEFLADEGRINLTPLHALLDGAWLERSEDASGISYRLTFERAGIAPEDALHAVVAELLRKEAAELLVEDIGIGEIYGFSITLDLSGENGRFEQSIVQAEFNTELGLVAFTSTTRNIGEGGWTFSSP